MNQQANIRATFDWSLRCAVFVTLVSLCSLLAVTFAARQQDPNDENDPRRIWDPRFKESRPSSRKPVTRKPPVNQSEQMNGELIGVTIWRLRPAMASDPQNVPRELTQDGEAVLERATANTEFREGDRVRLSVEYPRAGRQYLYLIDREEYRDGTLSEPKLIYPSPSTPPDGNVLEPGKLLYVPAFGDRSQYFKLNRKRQDQISERITLVISREPLTLNNRALVGPLPLPPMQVARWEKEWGGESQPKSYEARGNAGRARTRTEQQADVGGKGLDYDDPLPQTVYHLAVKPSGKVALVVPLKIASSMQNSTQNGQDVKPHLMLQRGHTATIRSIAFSPDGNLLATGGEDQVIKLWSVSNRKELRSFSSNQNVALSVAFHPGGQILASGNGDGSVRLWEAATGRQIRVMQKEPIKNPQPSDLSRGKLLLIPSKGYVSVVSAVAFSSDGRILASGSFDGKITLWDAGTGQEMASWPGHLIRVASITFSADGQTLVSGGYDGTVRFWNVTNGHQLHLTTGQKLDNRPPDNKIEAFEVRY